MDYLERLEQSLDLLEKEADELSQLPELIRTIGITADSLSKEKEEFRSATNAFQEAYSDLEQKTDLLTKEFEVAEESIDVIDKNLKSFREDFNLESQNNQRRINNLIEDFNQESKEIQRKLNTIREDLNHESKDLQEKLAVISNKIEENGNATKKLTTLIIVCIVIAAITCGVAIASMFGIS